MFPNNFEIKNFSFQKQKHGPTNCTVCHNKSILRINCVICQNPCCMNKCTYQITPNDVANKPWLSDKVWNHICLNCLPRTSTASDNDVKKLFAQIFSPSNNDGEIIDEQLENNVQGDEIPPIDDLPLMDKFIGANLKTLLDHNNIKFDKNGNLTDETMKNLITSFKGLLKNPL